MVVPRSVEGRLYAQQDGRGIPADGRFPTPVVLSEEQYEVPWTDNPHSSNPRLKGNPARKHEGGETDTETYSEECYPEKYAETDGNPDT